jgi:hypothetical protein
LVRAIADAAPMAALTSVVFGNTGDVDPAAGGTTDSSNASLAPGGDAPPPSSKSLWMLGRQHFFRGLVICAGRRHALGLEGSGCQRAAHAGASSSSASSARSRLLASAGDWQWLEAPDGGGPSAPSDPASAARNAARAGGGARSQGDSLATLSSTYSAQPSRNARDNRQKLQLLEDFGPALRPLLTYYAVVDALALRYSAAMDDVPIEEAAGQLAERVEACRSCRTAQELLALCSPGGAAPAPEAGEVVALLQRGMVAA